VLARTKTHSGLEVHGCEEILQLDGPEGGEVVGRIVRGIMSLWMELDAISLFDEPAAMAKTSKISAAYGEGNQCRFFISTGSSKTQL
jgi:hypothetical protein